MRRDYQHKLKGILGLSLQIAKADFKLRHEGSYLGILWYLLEPFLMFVILLSIRNLVGKGIESYPLYLLLGLIMFNFFRKATSDSVKAISGNGELIKSIKVDHEAFVVASVLKAVFSHIFEVIVFVAFLLFFKAPALNIVFYPLVFIFFCLFILGVAFTVSVIGAYVNDMENVWEVFTRLLWFATPIFYTAKSTLWLNFNLFNPVYYIITISREMIIYNRIPELWMILGMVAYSLAFFAGGIFIFERFKDRLAEIV